MRLILSICTLTGAFTLRHIFVSDRPKRKRTTKAEKQAEGQSDKADESRAHTKETSDIPDDDDLNAREYGQTPGEEDEFAGEEMAEEEDEEA